jgi:acyl-coenzyme A thioesterase PaaI-like protein
MEIGQMLYQLLFCGIICFVACFPVFGSIKFKDETARVWAEFYLRYSCLIIRFVFNGFSVCRLCSRGSFIKQSLFLKYIFLEHVRAGEVNVLIRVNPGLQNSMQSLHGGAAALIVDEITTAAVMSQGCWPGVSVSLNMQYLDACKAGEQIRVCGRVAKRGNILVQTEAKLSRLDGTLLCKGTHVKYVVAPILIKPFLALRPWLAQICIFWMIKLLKLPSLPTHAIEKEDKYLKPMTDPQKAEYYRNLATTKFLPLGFDQALDVALHKLDAKQEKCDTYEFTVSSNKASNALGGLHGAASTAFFDIMGSAAIASHPAASGLSCGVATNLDIQFGVAGKGPIKFVVRTLRLGGRLAFCEIICHDCKGRLVAQGSVTKYGTLKLRAS